jgi:hypothetical protein
MTIEALESLVLPLLLAAALDLALEVLEIPRRDLPHELGGLEAAVLLPRHRTGSERHHQGLLALAVFPHLPYRGVRSDSPTPPIHDSRLQISVSSKALPKRNLFLPKSQCPARNHQAIHNAGAYFSRSGPKTSRNL